MKFELPKIAIVNFETSDNIADLMEDETIEPGTFDSTVF